MLSSSSATVRVEKATSSLLIGPDWTMNMDICDSVNSDHSQVKEVVKAVKKRLQHKNPKVQFLALTLLETMIKNCGELVHLQVVERDILQEMVKIVKKKNDIEVRDKILVLLDSWQEAFGGAGGKYPQYYAAYIDLKHSGLQFPQRSADSALIFTPSMTHPAPVHRHPQAGHGMPSNASSQLEEAMASEMANLSTSDLDGIQNVFELLSDMLKAVNPNDCEAVKDEVITDLVNRCRSNQHSLIQYLNSTVDEELLGRGLTLNDNLQTVLAKHDAIASGSPLPPTTLEVFAMPSTPVASAPVATKRLEDEVEDDDFVEIARRFDSGHLSLQFASLWLSIFHFSVCRSSKVNPSSTQSISDECGVYPISSNRSDLTVASSSTEASSSLASNALTLSDSSFPVKTTMDEQDMIDLMSLTLSSNSTPRLTPAPQPAILNMNGPPVSVSPNGHWYTNPHSHILNQGYNSYNSYVAPWARPQPQPEVPQFSTSYPPPPWEFPATADANPFSSTTYPYATSYDNGSAASASSYMPMFASQYQQQHNSFDARVSSAASTTDETHKNACLRQPASAAAEPYVLPSKLFDDLIDLRMPDGNLKTSNTPPVFSDTTGQKTPDGTKLNPGT